MCARGLGGGVRRPELAEATPSPGNGLWKVNADGTITVRWSSDDAGAHLSVADTGIGIAPADAERIFEPFVRLDAARAVRHVTGATEQAHHQRTDDLARAEGCRRCTELMGGNDPTSEIP